MWPISEKTWLCKLFQTGYEYHTIGNHRSAISTYHDLVDGDKVT